MGAAPLRLAAGRLTRHRQDGDRRFELEAAGLVLRAGESLCLVGPSGCGKSTLIHLLALALRPDECSHFSVQRRDGSRIDLAALWRRGDDGALAALRARHCGYVLQTGGLLPFLTVRDNIALVQRLAGRAVLPVEDLADRLGLAGMLDSLPERLSVGQRQRVAVARAVAHGPELILADEPTAALDPETGLMVMALLLDLVRETGAALIAASHDLEMVDRLGLPRLTADHRLLRRDGGSVAQSRFLMPAAVTAEAMAGEGAS